MLVDNMIISAGQEISREAIYRCLPITTWLGLQTWVISIRLVRKNGKASLYSMLKLLIERDLAVQQELDLRPWTVKCIVYLFMYFITYKNKCFNNPKVIASAVAFKIFYYNLIYDRFTASIKQARPQRDYRRHSR